MWAHRAACTKSARETAASQVREGSARSLRERCAVLNWPARAPLVEYTIHVLCAFNTQDHPAGLALNSAEATLGKTILLFLKFPEPGQVKTRLAATVGAATAALIYRRMVAR